MSAWAALAASAREDLADLARAIHLGPRTGATRTPPSLSPTLVAGQAVDEAGVEAAVAGVEVSAVEAEAVVEEAVVAHLRIEISSSAIELIGAGGGSSREARTIPSETPF
jgi:hypothetical protein